MRSISSGKNCLGNEVMSGQWEDLGLSTCSNLRSLTFLIPLPDIRITGPPTWELVLYILSNMPCKNLETLRITFEHRELDVASVSIASLRLKSYDWGQLARLMSRFKHLRQPVLSLTHHDAYWNARQRGGSIFQFIFDGIMSEWFKPGSSPFNLSCLTLIFVLQWTRLLDLHYRPLRQNLIPSCIQFNR